MYQSIPILTIPPGKPLAIFFLKGEFPPLGHKESTKHRTLGQKNCAKTPPPGQLFSNIQQNNMNETEIIENSTKMLICLKHLKAQSFLVGGFYGYSKYLKSFSIHL